MSKRKYKIKKRKTNIEKEKTCHNCEHCLYVGDGGYYCDVCTYIVVEDWQPTEEFLFCEGKDFEQK